MSNLNRLKNIAAEIKETVEKLQSLENDKFCAQMAERSYSFEVSVIKQKERNTLNKLDALFDEMQQVYKEIKGA